MIFRFVNFDFVPQISFKILTREFYIGGYQPAQNSLRSGKGEYYLMRIFSNTKRSLLHWPRLTG
jgi:hypothetical protein